uniref:LRAT domain-containing protein n=1 Tax=Parastrongyloides trichosuri TaxID=131310 RepID=A0A0N4ZMD8_PARTI
MSSGFLFNVASPSQKNLGVIKYDDFKFKYSEIYGRNRRPIETVFVSVHELKDSLRPGDIIEFKYKLFNHWAIFLGISSDLYIIAHFRVVGPPPSIKHDVFIEVMDDSRKARINNICDHDSNKNIRSADEIRSLAMENVFNHKPYNLLCYNCKDFAKDMRYF